MADKPGVKKGKDLTVVGHIKHCAETGQRHEAHGLTFPAGVSGCTGCAARNVVAGDAFGAADVCEPRHGFNPKARFFKSFLDGVHGQREPRLKPPLGKCGFDSCEGVTRMHEPDTIIGLKNDAA